MRLPGILIVLPDYNSCPSASHVLQTYRRDRCYQIWVIELATSAKRDSIAVDLVEDRNYYLISCVTFGKINNPLLILNWLDLRDVIIAKIGQDVILGYGRLALEC